jgi:hypothetical protein
MTDPMTPTAATGQTPAEPPGPRHAKSRQAGQAPRGPQAAKTAAPRPLRTNPTLEKLAEFYPHLFGEVFLPLKRGIFQDLLAAHPEVIEREALKEALAQHTRSTRYLSAVAAGQPRHDLKGQVAEAMAPEHVYQALLEVFRRRHARSGEDPDGRDAAAISSPRTADPAIGAMVGSAGDGAGCAGALGCGVVSVGGAAVRELGAAAGAGAVGGAAGCGAGALSVLHATSAIHRRRLIGPSPRPRARRLPPRSDRGRE